MRHEFIKISYIFFAILIVTIFSASCSGEEFTTQYFTYPPNTNFYEKNWDCIGVVKVFSDVKPITNFSDKRVEILIKNKEEKILLREVMRFRSGSIRSSISWKEFDSIEVSLFEVGNKYAEDDYNKKLMEKGEVKLARIIYIYDKINGVFIKNTVSN